MSSGISYLEERKSNVTNTNDITVQYKALAQFVQKQKSINARPTHIQTKQEHARLTLILKKKKKVDSNKLCACNNLMQDVPLLLRVSPTNT